ncbi:MAG: LysR family transcriptional regulator [Gammaproteobacteria bacterium]|nr:LysR family transcriptional regulator [Gammaproteobacteria bacterium]
MDTIQLRTFLEVVESNSFSAAAKKLFISQSAVSLRIKSLEEQLGKTVFLRSKSGVNLTVAGRRLQRYAQSMVHTWEDAKLQIGVPERYEDIVVVCAERGLWERLLIRWLPELGNLMPSMAFRAEEDLSANIMRQMVEGIADIAVLYNPQIRPGIEVMHLFDESIVMVTTDPAMELLDDNYFFIDWGAEFSAFHSSLFPNYEHARYTFRLGHVMLNYLLNNGGSAFLPRRLVQSFIDFGKLHIVPDVPDMTLPVHVAWRVQAEGWWMPELLDSLKDIAERSLQNELPQPFWAENS